MSTENPTPLRVGAKGALEGWNVRVAGRVVMGMEDGGETYYWNEFNLADGFGRTGTLVFEETESGPEWKLFRSFEPLRSLNAREAATKCVGDKVSLDGIERAITLVDESRVHHIEGTAPEGVEVGDVANYFNVDTGEHMLVASWTGDEIEFFQGHDVPAETVAQAFGFSNPAGETSAAGFFRGGENAPGALSSPASKGVLAALAAIALFGLYSCYTGGRGATSPAAKRPASVVKLAPGASGVLAGKPYSIASHATIEIARIGGRFDRHEYQLLENGGIPALLVNGLNGGEKEWHLLLREDPPPALTPYDAAALRKDAGVRLRDRSMRLTFLFQSRRLDTDGRRETAPWPPGVQYGFVAQDGADALIARWTENEIQLYRGRRLNETEILPALQPVEKGRR